MSRSKNQPAGGIGEIDMRGHLSGLSDRLVAFGKLHGEKAGFTLCVLFALVQIGRAIQTEVYSYSPEELTKGAAEIERILARDADISPPFPAISERRYAISPLDERDFGPLRLWFRNPMTQNVSLRGLELLPLQRLQATYGRAPFRYLRTSNSLPPPASAPIADGGKRDSLSLLSLDDLEPDLQAMKPLSSEITEGRRYVILTGVVPWSDQQSLFDQLPLFNRVPPSNNTLRYEGFIIERAELSDAGAGTWQVLDPEPLIHEMGRWPHEQPELAVGGALVEGLSVPLGPRTIPWQAEEVVPAGIPTRQAGEAPVAQHVAPPRHRFEVWSAEQSSREESPPLQPVSRPAMELSERMFRAFDFTIEPGKRYQYRVRLVVHNPNFGLHPDFLNHPELSHNTYEITPYGQPTKILEIPRDWQLLAGPAKPRTSVYPTEARLGVEMWDSVTGAEGVGLLRIRLGRVLDTQLTIRYLDPLSGVLSERPAMLATDTMLVDLVANAALPRKFQQIGGSRKLHSCELLLLESTGALVRLDSVDHFNRYLEIEETFAAPLGEDAVGEDGLLRSPHAGQSDAPTAPR